MASSPVHFAIQKQTWRLLPGIVLPSEGCELFKTKRWPYECGDRVIEQLLGSLLVAAKFGGRKETLDKDAVWHWRRDCIITDTHTKMYYRSAYSNLSPDFW